jgi:hypothetical protein
MEMQKKSTHTINTLLEELKQKFPCFEKKQIFEILKSIYPDSSIPREKRNITYGERTFTKPLAVSRKDKARLIKEESDLISFFKNTSRGDFIQVIETDGKVAKCENLSLKEDIRKKYYSDSPITISFKDIANGTVKLFRRKVDKYIGG